MQDSWWANEPRSHIGGIVRQPVERDGVQTALGEDELVWSAARRSARQPAGGLGRWAAPRRCCWGLTGEVPDEPLCVDLDATPFTAYSDGDEGGAAVTERKDWGFHALLACLDRGDGLGEALAGVLRPGQRRHRATRGRTS